MAESEQRSVLLATQVSVHDEQGRRKPTAAEKGHAIDRLRIVGMLMEGTHRSDVVIARLTGDRSEPTLRMSRMAALARADRWDELRAVVADLSWDDVSQAANAWLRAEQQVVLEVGETIEALDSQPPPDVRPTPDVRPPRDGRPPRDETPDEHEDGDLFRSVHAAGLPESAPMLVRGRATVTAERPIKPAQATLPGLLATKGASGKQAIEYLYPNTSGSAADAARLYALAKQKEMAVTGFIQARRTEPVGYLHLEKLFFEPEGVVQGELVQTIPLMPGETRRFTHAEWANTRSEYAKVVVDSMEKFAEQTLAETSELSESSKSESSRDVALALATNVSGSYGGVTFGASTGLNVNLSEQQSRSQSATLKREVTQKASSRAKQERKVEFHFSTEEGTSDLAFQEITNTSGQAVTWAYNRLMTKWKITLARYDVRLTYDLVVPDPANRLLRQHEELRQLRTKLDAEDAFTLRPADITRETYSDIAAQYGAPIDAPPAATDTVVRGVTLKPQKSEYFSGTLTLTPPSGYEFTGEASVFPLVVIDPNDSLTYEDYAASNGTRMTGVRGNYEWFFYYASTNQLVGGSITLQVVATVKLQDEKWREWVSDSWERVHDAYQARRQAQRAEWRRRIEEIEQSLGGLDGLSLRKLEREEIMRVALSWLVGPQFDFYPDVLPAPAANDLLGPGLGLYADEGQIGSDVVYGSFLRHGDLIRFLHQAIEWENVLYVVYPYFWTHESRWRAKDDIRHPDLIHQAFLRGGAARVVLTIRPGFEKAFLAYQQTGDLDATLPAGHPYVTVADELKNMAETSYPYTPAANPPDEDNIVDTWHEFTPNAGLYVHELTL